VLLALLADRDAAARRVCADHLLQCSYEIDETDDGRDALAKAIARNPSLIVTAAQLPGVSGIELCRLLRSDALTTTTPIIVVTDDTSSEDVALAEAAGASAVLVKPLLPERMKNEITRILAASEQLRERSLSARDKVALQVAKSSALFTRAERSRHVFLSHAHQRGVTRDPSIAPPVLVCPSCSHPLRYVKSHVGGVSARFPEQWDYFECPACRTVLEYRQRTRKLRVCSEGF
jgi:DNA-binding response OmpR family regulator/uncharacterized protein YbaR (Trm112 family)